MDMEELRAEVTHLKKIQNRDSEIAGLRAAQQAVASSNSALGVVEAELHAEVLTLLTSMRMQRSNVYWL